MTTTPPDARNALAEIVAGLDGVTLGPWRKCGGATPYYTAITARSEYIVFGMADNQVHKEGGSRIAAPDMWGQQANAAHIARCYPEVFPAIATLVSSQDARIAALEAQVEGMRVALERSGELLEYGGFDLGFIDAALQSSETTGDQP